MNKEQPNYYAILPAQVRYDKNLKANEKLLYAEISALANKEGYCWASNSYFAELYGVSVVSVSNWITNLTKNGYIERKIIRNEKKEIVERRLYLSQSLRGIKKNIDTPNKENFKENNTSNNNKYNSNTFSNEKDIAVTSSSDRQKIKELQKMIDDKGAGFKATQPKPQGRTARAFTNEARKRAGREPIPKDGLLQLLTYWQKYNPALNPLNKTEREPAKKLLEMWGDDWREKLDLVFKVQEYKYCKIIATTPKEVFKNYTALKLTLKKIKNENNRKNN